MSKKWLMIFAVVVAAGLAIFWKIKQTQTASARRAMKSIQVTEGPIEQTVDATGEVAPLNRVEIKPPVQGRIDQLLMDEGDEVQVGQRLAVMSSQDRAAIIDAARGQGPDALKYWEDAYKPTPIVAPLSGTIILRNVVVGQTVDPTVVLYAMSDFLIVIAQVDESDIGKIKLGMPARVTLDAFPNRTEQGKVFQILEEGVNVSNVITYNVKVKILPKSPSYYRSQMTANISFLVQSKEKAVLVPLTALHENSDGDKEVLVPGPEGKPTHQEVTLGIENDTSAEVIDGLKVGDTILVKQTRYTPQQAAQSSPLTLGGRPGSGGSGGGGGRGH